MKRLHASVTWAISLFFLLAIPTHGYGAEVLLKGFLAPADGIFFTEPDANRLLQEVERCQILKEEISARTEYEISLRKEIEEREKREQDCTRAVEAAKRGGSLWDRVKSAGKWILVGGVIVSAAAFAR